MATFQFDLQDGISQIRGTLRRNSDGTRLEARTDSRGRTRLYLMPKYKRSTPVTSDETLARQRFGAICVAVNARRKNLSTIAADTAAFNAQKETGYKTLYQYLWHECADEYDLAQG